MQDISNTIVPNDDPLDFHESEQYETTWSTMTTQKPRRSNKKRRTYGCRSTTSGPKSHYDTSSARSSRRRSLFQNDDSSIIPAVSLQNEFLAESSKAPARHSESTTSISSSISSSLSSMANDPMSQSEPAWSSSSRREFFPSPPKRPSKSKHRRSISMSHAPKLPRPVPIQRASTTSNRHDMQDGSLHSSLTESLSSFSDWKENTADPCSPPSVQSKKRVYVRRSSMTGSVSTGDMSRPLKARMSRRNSMPSLETVSHPAQLPDFLVPAFDMEKATETNSSPSAQSIAASVSSSRKRGITEEPFDDNDCPPQLMRFSPPPDPLRSCESLAFDMDDGFEMDNLDFERRGRATMLSDDEEEVSEDDLEADVSDEASSESTVNGDSPCKDSDASDAPVKVALVEDEEDVLRTAPSLEDLKFVIRELKRDTTSRKPVFGACSDCKVFPKQNWPQSRRVALVEWARKQLGFTLRLAGQDQMYLQIPTAKGKVLHKLLLGARDLHKQREQEGVATEFGTVKKRVDKNSMPDKPTKHHTRSLSEENTDPTDASLVDVMNSLSLDPSLVRIVTLEEDNASATDSRLVLSPSRRDSRQSFGSHVGVDDGLRNYMLGLTPVVPSTTRMRPAKLSIGSVGSHMSNSKSIETTPMNRTITVRPQVGSNQSSFDFVTTPLMKQSCQAWGSRPISGRDWGNSEECNQDIIMTLTDNLSMALREANMHDVDSPNHLPRSASICLDMEAESSVENDDYSVDSDEERDNFEPLIDTPMNITTLGIPGEHLLSADKQKLLRRRMSSLAMHKRRSICVSLATTTSIFQKKSLFESSNRGKTKPTVVRDLSKPSDCFQIEYHEEKLNSDERPLDTITEKKLLSDIFCFLDGRELLTSVSLVCSAWSDAATDAYAELMLASVGCLPDDENLDCGEDDFENLETANSVALSMERSWKYLMTNFPFASFLSEGAFKRVYKVKNSITKAPEAVSIMDVDLIESTGNRAVVATELAVSVMLSSLTRRGICPNFVVTRGVFTCPFEPPSSHWGSAENKNHHVHVKTPKNRRTPKEPGPKHRGRYQYIRMELCTEGDAEEYIKEQPSELLPVEMSRNLLFQISFALHAAASKFSLKHYDMKLLNVFLQDAKNVPGAATRPMDDIVLRYGLGSKNFALRMPSETALIAKVADYGTADVKSESNGQPLSLAQFTTLENTPPDFLILGDSAKQGHEHDSFGLGLCMLHLFTGKAPYEEILVDVNCPRHFKESLQSLWENENVSEYSVIRSVILSDVYKDEAGNIVDGEPDETFYDTLYRFLVLFGIPKHKFQRKQGGKVWKAIADSFDNNNCRRGKDVTQFDKDRRKYSLSHGTNKFIKRARKNLEMMDGGMDLLLSLVNFDPAKRATALEALNSDFFKPLTETPGTEYKHSDVRSFTSFST